MKYRAKLTLIGALLSIFVIFTPQPAGADDEDDNPEPTRTFQDVLNSCLPGNACGPDDDAPEGVTREEAAACGNGYYDNGAGGCGSTPLLEQDGPGQPDYGQIFTPSDQCFNPSNPFGSRISTSGPCPPIWCSGRNPTTSSPRLLAQGCSSSGAGVDCDAATSQAENALCGGGDFDPCAVYPYCSPPAPPPPPPTPATPATGPNAPIVDCFDDGAGSLRASSIFAKSSASLTRWDYRVRWLSDRATGFIPVSLQQQITAAQTALAYAQTPAAQADATSTAATAAQARDEAHESRLPLQQADTALNLVRGALARAERYSDNADDSATDALISWIWANLEVSSLRSTPVSIALASQTATVAADWLPSEHETGAFEQSLNAATAADQAEMDRQDAEDHAALADSPAHPEAAVAIAHADFAKTEAEAAELATTTARAHVDAIRDFEAAIIVERDDLAVEVAVLQATAETAEEAAREAADLADITAWQETIAVLQSAIDPHLIEVDDSPSLSGSRGTSTVVPPLIASFDELSSNLAYRISRRASASNAYGTSYSSWSSWSGWSPWSPLGYDLDDDGDELGNGIQDDISNCPIPTSAPPTPPGTPCAHDPAKIAAVYPPGHAQAGQPTGHCYPPGSPCLPVAQGGTGAADVVCSPRGS